MNTVKVGDIINVGSETVILPCVVTAVNERWVYTLYFDGDVGVRHISRYDQQLVDPGIHDEDLWR